MNLTFFVYDIGNKSLIKK
jgi:hypothetical protein